MSFEVWNSIIFLSFKTSLLIAPLPTPTLKRHYDALRTKINKWLTPNCILLMYVADQKWYLKGSQIVISLFFNPFYPNGGVLGLWQDTSKKWDRDVRLYIGLGTWDPGSISDVGTETRVTPQTLDHYHR